MSENEATVIGNALQTMVPPTVTISVSCVDDDGPERYVVIGSNGLRLDYAWQYLELRLIGVMQAIQQSQQPQLVTAGSLPNGFHRG